MFLQKIESLVKNNFEDFFQKNYNKKYMIKNLTFLRSREIQNGLMESIWVSSSVTLTTFAFGTLIYLINIYANPLLFVLCGLCFGFSIFLQCKVMAYFIFKLLKPEHHLIQDFYKSIFNEFYISDEILNLLKIYLSPDEYKKLRFNNKQGITYYALKSFLKEKKQYMDIEQEQLNVTLTAKEINNLIDHYENKNLVKFDRIK